MTSWMQILTPEETEQYRAELLRSYRSPRSSISSPTDEEAIKYLERNTIESLIEQWRSSIRNPLNSIDDYLLKPLPN